MGARHIAVVGASLAGLRTVEALRRLGHDGRITLIGDEAQLPYDRPPLSKEVLLGKAEIDAIGLTTKSDLESLEVDLRLASPARGLDLGRRTLLLDEAELAFDDLVISTGASAKRPSDLAELDGIHVLRTSDDAVAIRNSFENNPQVVILGGGFIGTEVASSARDLGLDVTVVDIASVMMERSLGPVVGARMGQIAVDAGVRLRLRTSIAGLSGADRIEAVTLSDGSVIQADLLVIGIGAAPNTAWLDDSGLEISDGIVCDEFLAAAPGVYAAGDVARWTHPLYARSVRCEHWTAAGEHADAVAATLTGTPTVADAVPYAWSDQFGHKLQVAGLPQPGDEVRFLVDEPDKFMAVAGSHDGQSAAFALNAPGALVRQRIKLAASPPWHERTEAR